MPPRQTPSALPALRTTILRATWIALALGATLVACAKKPMMIPFLQKAHREAYRFTEQDLERIKFYSSSDVVVEELDGPPGKEGIVLVDDANPGVAVGSGPGWIRVGFPDTPVEAMLANAATEWHQRKCPRQIIFEAARHGASHVAFPTLRAPQ